MKLLDIRYTSSHGWVADVLLSYRSILPVSIPVMECDVNELIAFAASDPEHDAIGDIRTPEQIEMDTMDKEWKETYQSLI